MSNLLSFSNKGSLAEKVSKTLQEYYSHVGVSNLQEALNRLESENKYTKED